MICFEVKKGDDVLYSNLSNISEEPSPTTITRNSGELTFTIAASGRESRILGSNRHVHDTLIVLAGFAGAMDKIKIDQGNDYTIVSHNLITTHSRLQDVLESIIPEEALARANDHAEQIDIVKKLLQEDIRQSASSFLDIIKRVVDLQAQIEGFKILSGERKPDIGEHNILKVIQNVIHPFYADLLSNHVSIRWHIDPEVSEANKVRTDYKALNVILHHILTNAVKYTMPHSRIDIEFDHNNLELSFLMKSVRIERDELAKIFDLRYCGRNVPKALAGEGVGMFMVKKATALLDMEIVVTPDYSAHIEDLGGIKYCPNTFTLRGFKTASL